MAGIWPFDPAPCPPAVPPPAPCGFSRILTLIVFCIASAVDLVLENEVRFRIRRFVRGDAMQLGFGLTNP